jgi:hypothetical protein
MCMSAVLDLFPWTSRPFVEADIVARSSFDPIPTTELPAFDEVGRYHLSEPPRMAGLVICSGDIQSREGCTCQAKHWQASDAIKALTRAQIIRRPAIHQQRHSRPVVNGGVISAMI